MFWVALAALIMVLTGAGDDTAFVRFFFDKLEDSVRETVREPTRKTKALEGVAHARDVFASHRERIHRTGSCIDRLDRDYRATPNEYRACLSEHEVSWERLFDEYLEVRRNFLANVTPEEASELQRRMLSP